VTSISWNGEGGTDGVDVSTGNSGGRSGTAWDTVQKGTGAKNEYDTRTAGGLALLVGTGATSTTAYCQWQAKIAALWASGMTTSYGRVYVTVAAIPGADRTFVELLATDGTTNRGNIRVRSTGAIRIRNAANGTVTTSTTILSANVRYRVEWRADGSVTGAWQLQIFLGESLTPLETLSGTDNFGGTIGTVNFGYVAAASNHADMWLDGMQLNDAALPGPAPAAVLVDDFAAVSLDATRWTAVNNAGVTGSQTGGRYEFATSNDSPAYSSLTSVHGFDLTGDRFVVKVPDPGDRTIASLEVYISAQNRAGTDRVFFNLVGLFMGFYQTVGGSQTFLNAVAYDPMVDVYFRIREAAGTIYWDTSTDGVSWTNKHSVAAPIQVLDLHLQLMVGEYGSEPAGATTVAFDDVGIPGAITVALGQASETDSVNAITRTKTRAIGLVTESDTAQAISRSKARAIGLATELDTVQSITRAKYRSIGQVTEVDTVTAISPAKLITLGLATETDTVLSPSRTKVRSIGLATEASSAQPITRIKVVPIGQAVEVDSVFPIGNPPLIVMLGLAVETSTVYRIRAAQIIRRPSTGYVIRPDTGMVSRP
jgi:hypothetical protein